MPLFEITPPVIKPKQKTEGSKVKLKKGETISSLIETAKRLVEEKLGDYKNASKCITDINDLKRFFDETEENAVIAVDTETTG